MQTKRLKLSDIISSTPISSAITPSEQKAFLRAVEEEMKRRGFAAANQATAASERLSESDFSVRINAR